MTLNEYQERAMTTCMESCKNDTYMLFGLMAEVGEVADKIAKWKDAGYLAEELMYEVGDIMWFCAGLARQFGWSLENVCWANLNKLSSRQERGVIEGDGDNR